MVGGVLCASRIWAPWALAAAQGDLPKLPPARIYQVYAGRTGDLYLGHPTEELARFRTEAEAIGRLQHPNIVAIYDRGIDRGRHYLALEYVKGGDFHDHIQRCGPLGAAAAISVVRSVASGLKYAASRGVIHRDIKPSNILRTAAGQAKIIDLGLAKAVAESHS